MSGFQVPAKAKRVTYVCNTPGCSERMRGGCDEPLFCSVCLEDLTPMVLFGVASPSTKETMPDA